MTGNHILRALEPLKTNDRDCAALDFAALNTTVCEHIDLLSRCCRLGQLHPGFHRDAGPRIRNVLVEILLIKSMHDPPSFATEKHNLLRGPPLRSERETIIDLVSTSRGVIDLIGRDPIPFLRNHFAKFAHRPLVLFAER
jgi:hypothetical protein